MMIYYRINKIIYLYGSKDKINVGVSAIQCQTCITHVLFMAQPIYTIYMEKIKILFIFELSY